MGNLQKSAQKHDVHPTESEEIFFNSPLIISNDTEHSNNEKRYLVLGITNKKRFLTVICTLRESDTLIRVISARDQYRKKRIVYAKATKT
ncbi:BrnT family toxin [Polynucleobacter kasalickyi]|uniref:BrnT family toxin n=1 Tax=Polynucleobacter kasalickyi TaxID=1938817 RepID=UPI002100C176|nr:BrnT family toxin [Polynucleobacter kasalickyi]